MAKSSDEAGIGSSWNTHDVYLFDVDGTLINCTDATHYFAFCEALQLLSGMPLTLEGVTAHGNTDVGILRDALVLAGVQEENWRPRLGEACEQMCRFVHARKADLRIEVLPSVQELIARLKHGGALLGVATGNLECIGRMKLSVAGLLEHLDFGGYSDSFEYRADVFCNAAKMARELAGGDASICVIGDTPEDIRAARVNNLAVIGVATGVYSFAELGRAGPDRCLHSLTEVISERPKVIPDRG